ncbi:hypothetical protein ETAE_2262 [Edwardsiella piscicida]|uniref:Uncharacterized protein n=2 Tax=Edwardsiella TaxID=635 RepID=A0AAU8PTH2_EDWPI|nr:hypothetical protein ETAE_2262 [Edwardsiella tarda EIB202]AIJ06741.1 Hypothetical protein ETEE_0261 [Edwardsiella anguillarum ET080813]
MTENRATVIVDPNKGIIGKTEHGLFNIMYDDLNCCLESSSHF